MYFLHMHIKGNQNRVKMDNKQLAVNFLKMVLSGNIDQAFENYASSDMRHHNPYFPGDMESLKRGMEENQEEFPEKTLDIRRVIGEAENVTVHSHLRLNGADRGMAVVHILRFQNSKIVEMWDISQPVPEKSPNKNTMF